MSGVNFTVGLDGELIVLNQAEQPALPPATAAVPAGSGLFGRAVTSSTQNTVGGGVLTFTLDVDEGTFKTDYTVQILANGEPDVFMYGIVTARSTAVSPVKITVAVFRYSDVVGVYSDWTLQVIAGPFAGLPASQTLGVSTNSAAVPAIGDSLSWTTDTGKTFYDNSTVYVASVVDPTAFFFATVVSYNSGTGAIKFVVNRKGGSGTLALWTISLIDVTASFITTVGNVAYNIKPSDQVVALTATITTVRNWTLPAANSVAPGHQVLLTDMSGTISGSAYPKLLCQGGDSLIPGDPDLGANQQALDTPYFYLDVVSDGSSIWSYDISRLGLFFSDVLMEGALAVTGLLSANGGLAVVGLADLSDSTSGQIKFPATQNASANANTLDDYEEGTWTPAVTYATPGTSSATYVTQLGRYTKIGNLVFVNITLAFTPTIGTASGDLIITGLPFTPAASAYGTIGSMNARFTWSAGYTQVSALLKSDGTALVEQNGSASAAANIGVANMATGLAHSVQLSGCYRV